MLSRDEIKCETVRLHKETASEKDEFVTFVEQFVKDVTDFSSQYGSNISISYTAYNIAGNPSKFPDYGDFPQAFVMRTYGQWWDKAPSRPIDYMPQNNGTVSSQDYIDVSFYQEVYPIRVSIYETYNPGSVVRIWAQDHNKKWFKLWSGRPQSVPHKSRIFSPPLELCNFKTKLLRLEFNHHSLDYYTELDAVLLIGTSELIVPSNSFYKHNLTNLLKALGVPQTNIEDYENLTADYSKINYDLINLKNTINKHCTLYKSQFIEDISKGKLVSKLGLHCHCIPPIEEAFNSLQQFLQDEFPKLMKEIHYSSPPVFYGSTSSVKNSQASDFLPCGNLSALPDETLLKILKNLDLQSLCRLCRVNKHMNNIARDALLYKSINLKPYWHCVDAYALNCIMPRCQFLQRLDLSWCGNYNMLETKDIIHFIHSSGSNLTHLRLNCCQFVNDMLIIEISCTCKNLKELCLRNCTTITNDGFEHLQTLKSLERLELYRTTIETFTLCSIFKQNPGIKHINLASMHDRLNMDEVAIELGNSCPLLESIDFWKAQTLTPVGVRALALCTNLKEIDFGWCGGMGAPGDSLRALLTSCRTLEKVFLAAFRGLTDRDLEPLLLCPELRQLDLLGARCITPDICRGFFICCPKLEMIDLSFCDGINESQIQQWRQEYPSLSIKRSFQANDRNTS